MTKILSKLDYNNIWEYYLNLYKTCSNNKEFISAVTEENKIIFSNIVNNKDIYIKHNIDLVSSFKNNSLITVRLGGVESRFLVNNYFLKTIPIYFKDGHHATDDSQMKSNAGMYYIKNTDKTMVNDWWILNTINLLKNNKVTYMSCFLVLHYDLYILALLDIKNKVIDSYTRQSELIQYFYDRKILVISNGIEDMHRSYKLGLQRLYNIDIHEEKLNISFIKCPQTTVGMETPHSNMIETTQSIIDLIDKRYNDFDTILFCCGAYSSVLINLLSKIYVNKNLLYFGSELYTMFGLYSDGIDKPITRSEMFVINNFLPIEQPCPKNCKNIDDGKYWKK
jgi:hypothetical protein